MGRPEKKKDQDLEPIHFSEDYRRAKRNILAWGLFTSLVALGTADRQPMVETVGIVRGLQIPPTIMVLGTMLILIFMAIGYWRADSRLVLNNNYLNVSARRKEGVVQEDGILADRAQSANILEAAADLAESFESKLAKLEADFLSHNDALEVVVKLKRKWLDETPGSIGSTYALKPVRRAVSEHATAVQIVECAIKGNDPGDGLLQLKIMQDKFETATNHAEKFHSDLRKIVIQIENEIQNSLPSDRTYLEKSKKEIHSLSTSLRGLSKDLLKRERVFFFFYDRLCVVVLTAFALFLGAWNLIAPDNLAGVESEYFLSNFAPTASIQNSHTAAP